MRKAIARSATPRTKGRRRGHTRHTTGNRIANQTRGDLPSAKLALTLVAEIVIVATELETGPFIELGETPQESVGDVHVRVTLADEVSLTLTASWTL
jgi:hypothetical protein